MHWLLCPQSVWISGDDGQKLNVKIFNWQTELSEANNSLQSTGFGALHPEYFVEDISEVYLSPESATSNGVLAANIWIYFRSARLLIICFQDKLRQPTE